MWSKNLVSVIIVSCNNRDYIKMCLDSVRGQSYKPIEIILVNNCSKEDSLVWLKNNYPDITVIANKENLLFCLAHNRGISITKGEYTLCLNDDITLEKEFIEESVKAMRKDNTIGMVSGKIMLMDKKTIDTTGLFLARSRQPEERGYGQKDIAQYEKWGYIFGVGGAAGFYRRKMLEEIKISQGEYFDADYGIFYEDLDLSWRANRFGWKAYYTPQAVAYHMRGGTVKEKSPKARFLKKYNFAYLRLNLQTHLIKNRYMTIIKNDSVKAILSDFGYILLYDIKLWSYTIIFKPQLIWKTIKNIKYFLKAFKKRKAILGTGPI